MIPFRRVAEPAGFAAKVSKPGNKWLQLNPNAKRPKAFWTPYTPALSEGFVDLCGYAAMHYLTGGTVDHFLLGHVSVETAERYGECIQRMAGAKNDRTGSEP